MDHLPKKSRWTQWQSWVSEFLLKKGGLACRLMGESMRTVTLPKTDSEFTPEKWWYGRYFPFGKLHFQMLWDNLSFEDDKSLTVNYWDGVWAEIYPYNLDSISFWRWNLPVLFIPFSKLQYNVSTEYPWWIFLLETEHFQLAAMQVRRYVTFIFVLLCDVVDQTLYNSFVIPILPGKMFLLLFDVHRDKSRILKKVKLN